MERVESSDAIPMTAFTPVKQGDNHACIKQNRFQPPNPLRCFLLEPRSGTPEENLPNPATRGRPGSGWDDAMRRIASRTTLEGLQPGSALIVQDRGGWPH